MADSFREDDSYIPLFAQPPPPFAHNRGNLLGRPVLRAPAAGQPRPVPRRDGGGGGGGGGVAPSTPSSACLEPRPWPSPPVLLLARGLVTASWTRRPLHPCRPLHALPFASPSSRLTMALRSGWSLPLSLVPLPPSMVDVGCHSARLALLETGEFVDMQAKAVKRRAHRDALMGCSPRLQARAARDKIIDAVAVPLGPKTVAGIRAATAIKHSVVSVSRDV